MIAQAIIQISQGKHLSEEQAHLAVADIIGGQASDAQIAAFLMGLRLKGETVSEISGGAKALNAAAIKIRPDVPICVDPVGTGGDSSGTFNISSAAALLTAAAGAPVAKHGNRSVSSRSGSADVFEALGIEINLQPEQARRSIEENNFAFLYAPLYHPAMRHAAPVRKQLGIRTLFNLLGPLANPAGAGAMLLGVYSAHLLHFMAEALSSLSVSHALVVHSHDHLDEISLAAPTDICELKNGQITCYTVNPEDFGLHTSDAAGLQGGSPQDNAAIIESIFSGCPGAARDITVLNAGAALYTAGKSDSIRSGVELAVQTIDQGTAFQKLDQLRRYGRSSSLTGGAAS